jgi:hypothetical protein
MTNTVFSMFQTRYILDFLSASRSIVEHWDFPNTEISSLKMSLHCMYLSHLIGLTFGAEQIRCETSHSGPAIGGYDIMLFYSKFSTNIAIRRHFAYVSKMS